MQFSITTIQIIFFDSSDACWIGAPTRFLVYSNFFTFQMILQKIVNYIERYSYSFLLFYMIEK